VKAAKGEEKIKALDVAVAAPPEEAVAVGRMDLILEEELVAAARKEVSRTLPAERIAAILKEELDSILGLAGTVEAIVTARDL